MKYKMTSAIGLLLLFCNTFSFCAATTAEDNHAFGDTLRIMSSPSLMPLVNTWAGKFSEMNPPAKVAVSSASGLKDPGGKSLRIISETKNDKSGSGYGWSMLIGHNALVPVINAANPMLKKLIIQGVTASGFAKIISGKGKMLWSEIIPGGSDEYIHVYLSDEADTKNSLTDFTGTVPENQKGLSYVRSDEIVSLVENDLNSIGFCKLAEIRNSTGNELNGKIVLLPIDRNGNGRIDSFEKIYDNPDELTRGIWIGKYPSSLCGSIFAVSSEKPTAIDQLAFLRWVLTDGSQYMSSNGYVSLAAIERESGLTALAGLPIDAVGDVRSAGSYTFLIILASITVLVTIIVLIVKRASKTRAAEPVRISPAISLFNNNSIEAPNGIYYDKSHTWTFMERDGMVRLGVNDFIQRVTGHLTGIRMREPGEYIRRGEKILSIVKDGKQIDLYSPVSGTIRSLNTDLNIDASIINSSPYTDGWVYLIEPKNWIREMQLMFMADRYRQWLSDEYSRLKLFFSTAARENPTFAQVILQDGGELTENVLADLEPAVWEDFQTRFIDVSR